MVRALGLKQEIPVRVTLWPAGGFGQLFGCACTQLTDLAPARWDS